MAKSTIGKSKGSSYEREICVLLSRWWTGGSRDDIFWRSSASGGRATVRGKTGRRTAHQGGDVACTDPDGAALTDLFAIEIKRGYSSCTIHDLLDRGPKSATPEFEKWVQQACRSAEMTGTYSWLLITRRDRRLPMIWMDNEIVTAAEYNMAYIRRCLHFECTWMQDGFPVTIFGMLLSDFLDRVSRKVIEAMAKEF